MIARTQPTFVIVGAGGISRSYAQAFVQGLPYQIVGVADIRLESARTLRRCAMSRPTTMSIDDRRTEANGRNRLHAAIDTSGYLLSSDGTGRSCAVRKATGDQHGRSDPHG
jgi:hypothetical protein